MKSRTETQTSHKRDDQTLKANTCKTTRLFNKSHNSQEPYYP